MKGGENRYFSKTVVLINVFCCCLCGTLGLISLRFGWFVGCSTN
ncbi:stress response membrane protein YncL [Salmonella enterica subsp. enterica serovar Weltevreden]|nr:stress response membrane protein YncL [Salmonella enterica subsp. enterica serovar Weltevreden]